MTGAPGHSPSRTGWRDVRQVARDRIASGAWAQGDVIPKEVDLAAEFGCARATVNRALRELADEGLLDRRRRSGTRVVKAPDLRAQFKIPLIAKEIEARGARPGYRMLSRVDEAPPEPVRLAMELGDDGTPLIHILALYSADDAPFMIEDRWIDPRRFPSVLDGDFAVIGANEWLVTNAPFDRGEIVFRSASASALEAETLDMAAGSPVCIVERVTYCRADDESALTSVRQVFVSDYELRAKI